jgi:acyl carrier protein
MLFSKEDLKEKVIEAIEIGANIKLENELSNTTRIYNDLQLDSMDIANIVIFIEERYDLQIDEAKFKNATTIADVVDIVYEIQKK